MDERISTALCRGERTVIHNRAPLIFRRLQNSLTTDTERVTTDSRSTDTNQLATHLYAVDTAE